MVMLRGVFGADPVAGETPEERVENALAELGSEFLAEECNWYATLVVSRATDVPDEDIPTGFAFPESGFAIADEAPAWAKQPLDLLTTIASTIVDANVFSRLVLDDRVHLFALGKRSAGVPTISGSAQGRVTRGEEALAQLSSQLEILQHFSTRVERIRASG
jgi:hypothetical protein